MAHPDPEIIKTIAILVIVFTAGTIIPVTIVWVQNRTKMKAMELLKAYAEKGQEPPASVLDTVNRINWPFPPGSGPPTAQRPTRADHLAHLAGSVVCAIGSACVVWWRAPEQQAGHVGPLMLTAVVATIFFAGSAAARLVGALTTRDGAR